MKKNFWIFFFIIILLGCESKPKNINDQIPQNKPIDLVAIPEGVKYDIINSDVMPGIKRTLNIRLNQKVSKEVLTTIAMKLKDMDKNIYARTFILYYLPNMQVGKGAWATTHFDPDLKVNIQGIAIEDEMKMTENSEMPSRKVIGSWLDESPGSPSKIIIYFENEKYYMQNIYPDGSSGVQQIVKKPSSQGQRFERIKYSRAGDYYLIDSKGNLQIRDNEGLIATAFKAD